MTYKKLSDLTLDEIDNIIAKIEGVPFSPFPSSKDYFSPTTRWAHGGPLMDKYRVTIAQSWPGENVMASIWTINGKREGSYTSKQSGETALISAMRCIVRSKLGDTVEI